MLHKPLTRLSELKTVIPPLLPASAPGVRLGAAVPAPPLPPLPPDVACDGGINVGFCSLMSVTPFDSCGGGGSMLGCSETADERPWLQLQSSFMAVLPGLEDIGLRDDAIVLVDVHGALGELGARELRQ